MSYIRDIEKVYQPDNPVSRASISRQRASIIRSYESGNERVAILIPCYNEEKTIGKVVSDFSKAMPEATIYVYDNASDDATSLEAAKAGAVVRYEPRKGKGNVVRSMFKEIDADYYILVDGDDTYPAEYAPNILLPVVAGEADMVVGDRLSNGSYAKENKRRFHGFGNSLVCFMIKHVYGFKYNDVMTGYRAFSKAFVKTAPVLSDGFQVETELSIHAIDKNLKIANIPIEYRDRPDGSFSKLSTVRDGINVIKTIISLYKEYKPMKFFGVLGSIFCLISLFLIALITQQYFNTGIVERFPTLIVGVGIGVAGVVSFVCGIILDNIAKGNRRQWEIDTAKWFEKKDAEDL